MSDSNGTSAICGWVKAWHPKGLQVTLPVTTEEQDYAGMLANVTRAVEAGWLVVAPGLEDGEQKDDVGWVLRGEHEHDGKSTPFVLLYSTNEALTWSFLKVYLNKAEDVAAFEFASGMAFDRLPFYTGNDKPQRGAAAKTDRFIVKSPKSFGVVFKANPKHDPSTEQGKLKPARLFVRWADQRSAGQTPANGHPSANGHAPATEAVNEAAVNDCVTWLDDKPSAEQINVRMGEWRSAGFNQLTRARLFHLLRQYAALVGIEFDEKARRFVAPAPAVSGDDADCPF